MAPLQLAAPTLGDADDGCDKVTLISLVLSSVRWACNLSGTVQGRCLVELGHVGSGGSEEI